MLKKIISGFFAVIFTFFSVFSFYQPMVAYAASNDYTTWKQFDSAWNQAEAWTKQDFPNATMFYMKEAGCVVTSLSMLLRQYNVVTDSNVDSFNPWICNEQLKNAGAFNNAADLRWEYVSRAYPGFVYAGSKAYSAQRLTDLYNSGYACMVSVKLNGMKHYVAVRDASTSNATIMDPGSSYNTKINAYGTKYNIVYFKPTATTSAPTNDGSLADISNYNTPGNLNKGQAFSIKGTVTSSSPIQSLTVGVYTPDGTMVTGKTISPNTTSYNLKSVDNYILFDQLSGGGYLYMVTAKNGAGEKTLIASTFIVKNAGSTYCTIQPACAPNSRIDVAGGSTKSEANIQLYECNRTLSQQFELRPVSGQSGYYYIISMISGKALDVRRGERYSGNNIQQYDQNGTDSQIWGFTSVGEGYYVINTKLDSNLCMDVSTGGSSNGLNIQVYTRNNSAAQKFRCLGIG